MIKERGSMSENTMCDVRIDERDTKGSTQLAHHVVQRHALGNVYSLKTRHRQTGERYNQHGKTHRAQNNWNKEIASSGGEAVGGELPAKRCDDQESADHQIMRRKSFAHQPANLR